MRKNRVGVFGLVLASASLLGPASAQEEVYTGALSIESAVVGDTGGGAQAIEVVGPADFPEGTLLQVVLKLGERVGLWVHGKVETGRFYARLGPIRGKVVPGTYTIEVSYQRKDQAPATRKRIPKDLAVAPILHPVVLGDMAKQAEVATAVRKRLLDILQQERRVFFAIAQWGSFYINRCVELKLKEKAAGHSGAVPAEERSRVLSAWEDFARDFWEGVYAVARLDLKRYKEEVFLCPHGDADLVIEDMLESTDRYYSVMTTELYGLLDAPVPERIRPAGPVSLESLRTRILDLAHRARDLLGWPDMDWDLVDLQRPEEGEFDGKLYVSRTSKFRLELPDGDWYLDFAQLDPSVRLRVRPTDPEKRKLVAFVMEIHGYPDSEDVDDLTRQLLAGNMERWPGYKKTAGAPLSVPDATMPSGTRPGYHLKFDIQQGDVPMVMQDYALYCRWFKRTYDLLFVCRRGSEKDFEKAFEKLAKSFAILDAPQTLEGSDSGD